MLYDECAPRAAFNQVADAIDTTVLRNPINAWLREAIRREILRIFPPGSGLLEIGCGTGADAVFLAKNGRRITAIDISDRMVERARERVILEQLEGTVLVWRGRLRELASELGRSPRYPFDGAYANFSLGYEESVHDLATILHRLLKPGASFVFTLPNKLCVAEPIASIARLHLRRPLRRLREPLRESLHGTPVLVRVYTPARVRALLRGLFEVEDIAGMPVFMPPPSLYRPSLELLRATLEKFDDRLGSRFPWQMLGDSTLFHVRKVGR